MRKETELMELAKVKIIVGNRIYPAHSVIFENTTDQYPNIEAEAVLDPRYSTTLREAKAPLSITNVIFNPPATILFWSDHTKTVVKCDYSKEAYDPEKGIAMAIAKKMLGNKYEYYNTFLHWLKKWNKQQPNEYNPMNMYA